MSAGKAMFRPPESYVHGVAAPCVIVPARVAAWLERHTQLRALRTEARGTDPEVDAVLVALGVAAAAWRSSATGTRAPVAAEQATASETTMTTSQAATVLGVGERAVRQAIGRGRLPATRAGGRWLIEREDLEHYRQAAQAA